MILSKLKIEYIENLHYPVTNFLYEYNKKISLLILITSQKIRIFSPKKNNHLVHDLKLLYKSKRHFIIQTIFVR
ncbi:hypothetical protein KL86DYS1_31704 [uncultured Dysgonomonas sp.]|uniref:Uncharacterized protein n=1 Tax=uncultured Dysgonomonas sp. TaxID=206096 RepID=A0A212K798_9BACT|nr:hypothetical protein KL86DYS1_31704 [uncultured Dysgonomonas sp.]